MVSDVLWGGDKYELRCSCDSRSENNNKKLVPLSMFEKFVTFTLQLRANYLAIL